MQGSRFPAGSIRAAVQVHGDQWRHGTAAAHADSQQMKTDEYLRRAGATPAQRASWRMFNERNAAAGFAMPHPTK
jgi:hypothetical protein